MGDDVLLSFHYFVLFKFKQFVLFPFRFLTSMLLGSQRICLRKRDCSCGHSRQRRVILEFVVKISLPAGEMGDYLMPSFINTGNSCTSLNFAKSIYRNAYFSFI